MINITSEKKQDNTFFERRVYNKAITHSTHGNKEFKKKVKIFIMPI
jgi:hypothetical protein